MTFEESFPNERLRRARHLKGWTQSDLAEALDTDFETVSRWERGIAVPSSYYRGKLCDVLGKTPEELGLISDSSMSLPAFTSTCVFLSSSYTDAGKEVVTQLKADLQTRGFDVVSSHTMRRHGRENRRKVLQEVIRVERLR
jgi:transcriptional regulator with XRE-family HTH domain